MDKNEVIAYFDSLAPFWDEGNVRDGRKINTILENAGVKKGATVLDVACGTGVLTPYILEKGASSVGIDISSGMIKVAKEKYGSNPLCRFVVADAETVTLDEKFDSVIVYNAFPHFPRPEALISHLAGFLKKGGILSVAHGLSRDDTDACHRGSAKAVSMELLSAKELAEIFGKSLKVLKVISNNEIYQVSGKKE